MEYIYNELKKELDEKSNLTKELRKEVKRLKDINKRHDAEITYWKNRCSDRDRRIEYLESHSTEQQEILDRGYKQTSTFNKTDSGIYRIYNTTTGQSYVGQSSINVTNRCLSHFEYDEKCSQDDWHYDLQHNPDNYKYEIICKGVDNQGKLDRLEIYYIGKYNCLENGYNKVLQSRFNFLEGFVKKL